MKHVLAYLDIAFEKLTKNDYDNTIAITGDEGTGKSNLVEHKVDYWYTKLNGVCRPEDARHICLTRENWALDLRDAKRYEMTAYDEAGDINNRRTMSSFNTSVMEAYQIIRADNLYSILVLPSIWDLDGFFRLRRLRGIFHVWRRGKVAFWGRERMRRLLQVNESRLVKNMWLVNPTFIDDVPIYKGPLAEPYKLMKAEKLKDARVRFYDKISEAGNKAKNQAVGRDARNELAWDMMQRMSIRQVSHLTGLSRNTLSSIKKKMEGGG